MWGKPIIAAHILLFAVGIASARAEITVTRAEFAKGRLSVNGETSKPGQWVTLDERFRTRTNEYNEFHFRLNYRPLDCSVSIKAGQEIRPAMVANCLPSVR
jgi:hypothetical protein